MQTLDAFELSKSESEIINAVRSMEDGDLCIYVENNCPVCMDIIKRNIQFTSDDKNE